MLSAAPWPASPGAGQRLANNPLRVEQRTRRVDDGAGGLIEQKFKFPVWFEAKPSGRTPMCQALTTAKQSLEVFLGRFPGCYPPLVVNITDGMSTDGDPLPAAKDLANLTSTDGNVLLFNAHISPLAGQPGRVPGGEDGLPDNFAKLLFRMSSPLPPRLLEAARGDGFPRVRRRPRFRLQRRPRVDHPLSGHRHPRGPGGALTMPQSLPVALAGVPHLGNRATPPRTTRTPAPATSRAAGSPSPTAPRKRRSRPSGPAAGGEFRRRPRQALARPRLGRAAAATAGRRRSMTCRCPGTPRRNANWAPSPRFLGLAFRPGIVGTDGYWRALAVGDCCLFQHATAGCLRSFPLSARRISATGRACSARGQAELDTLDLRRNKHRPWQPGDRFLLMTDALAQWFLLRTEQDEQPLAEIRRLLEESRPEEAFAGLGRRTPRAIAVAQR